MDIEKGRYFTITNSDAEVFGRWHEGKAVDVGDAGQLAKLKSQGVLVDAKPHCSPQSSRRVDVEAPKESWSCKTRKTSLRNLALAFGLRLLWSRSEEHTSELQSLMRISYAVFCLKKKNKKRKKTQIIR